MTLDLNYNLPAFYPSWLRESFIFFETEFKQTIRTLDFHNTAINDVVNIAIFPGRRIRPSLYCAFWKIIDGCYPDLSHLFPAIALEIFHSASIVIDDIIDKEESRRNKPILFKLIGEDQSLLASHLLVSLGNKILTKSSKSKKIIDFWNSSYKRATIGALTDIYNLPNMPIKERCDQSLYKTIPFFEFIGKCHLTYLHLNDDYIKLFSLLGKTFQTSNDIFDFYHLDTSKRYSSDKSYRLNHSVLVPSLVELEIISESEVLQFLTYSRLLEILFEFFRSNVKKPEANWNTYAIL